MHRYLHLLRHAETLEKKSGEDDKERKLSDAGVDQARLMGSFLKKEKIPVELILTSTATRAQQTTNIVNEFLQLPEKNIFSTDDIYNAGGAELKKIIGGLDPQNEVILLVGHNPGLSWLAGYFLGEAIALPTAGLVVVRFESIAWNEITEGSGDLIRYADPDTIIKIS
jgi:phosphohistidine phosphatase